MKYSAALCFPHLEGETHLTSPKSMTFLFITRGCVRQPRTGWKCDYCGSVHNHKTISYYDTLLQVIEASPKALNLYFPHKPLDHIVLYVTVGPSVSHLTEKPFI